MDWSVGIRVGGLREGGRGGVLTVAFKALGEELVQNAYNLEVLLRAGVEGIGAAKL